MKLLFWVQHLLGIGHVARAAVLTRALEDAGFEVTVAFGGMPVERIAMAGRVRHLPPVRAGDQTFSTLLDAGGRPVDSAYLEARTRALVALGKEVRPDVVLIEAWPFGRRPFTPELTALLNACPDAFTAISVRDILQTRRKSGRAEETLEHVNRHADLLLVHADARVSRLADTYPLAGEIAVPVEHTGYVAPKIEVRPRGAHDIVVTAGGGAFGGPLMNAAAGAACLLPQRRWLLATGPNLPAEERPAATKNVVPVPYLDPLADHLAGAQVSVSQAGYNTSMDVLRAARFGTRAVLVPSDVTGQSEQLARARALERAGAATCLPESELAPKRLAEAVEAAPTPKVRNLAFDGAVRTADLLKEALERRSAR